MNPDDMDTFVFCLANKKAGAKLGKEMSDLTTFCPEKRSAPEKYGLPAGFVVMSEIPEVTAAMLDSKMIAILNKYPELVDSIHFSDQVRNLESRDLVNKDGLCKENRYLEWQVSLNRQIFYTVFLARCNHFLMIF